MKQLEVQIMGQSYLLGCPEGSEPRLLEAVDRVDKAMRQIRDNSKIKARDRISVLAALNLAFELTEIQNQAKPVEAASAGAPLFAQQALDFNLTTDQALAVDSLLRRLDAALGVDEKVPPSDAA